MAAETVRRFGIEPRVALSSHSNFGSDRPLSSNVGQALELVRDRAASMILMAKCTAMQRWWKRSATTVCRTALLGFCQYSGDAEHGKVLINVQSDRAFPAQ
ncbi:phosphate acyltransferase [Escherichia coli]